MPCVSSPTFKNFIFFGSELFAWAVINTLALKRSDLPVKCYCLANIVSPPEQLVGASKKQKLLNVMEMISSLRNESLRKNSDSCILSDQIAKRRRHQTLEEYSSRNLIWGFAQTTPFLPLIDWAPLTRSKLRLQYQLPNNWSMSSSTKIFKASFLTKMNIFASNYNEYWRSSFISRCRFRLHVTFRGKRCLTTLSVMFFALFF